MSRLTYSEAALRDLEGILDYIAVDRPEAAVRFVDSVTETCRLIAAFPGVGQPREDLASGLRLFSFRGHGIYFRVLDDKNNVAIERVLHGAMDMKAGWFTT